MAPLFTLPPSCRSWSPTGSILNLGIFAKGNLPLRYIQPSTWGNQRGPLLQCHHLFACCTFYYRFILSCFATPITHILPSLLRTSAPIQLLVVLAVLGTQETSCFLIAGLLERDHIQPLLP